MSGGFLRTWMQIAPVFIALPVLAFQTIVPPKSALDRRGLFHATVQGRFVSQAGEPVAGVHVQLQAGGVRTFPLVDVVSDVDGRFILQDVNSSYMPELRWYPTERWLKGGIALAGESGGNIDIGTIGLQPDTVIRFAVELVGGATRDPGDGEPTVALEEENGQFGFRIVAESTGRHLVLRQIPFEEGRLEVTLYRKGRGEYYHAPLRIQRGRRDQLYRLKLLRDTVKTLDKYSAEGKMEITEVLLPSAAIDRERHSVGRILGSDGTPIAGAIVGMNDFFTQLASPQWTVSGPDGHFDLKYTASACADPAVSYGHGDFVPVNVLPVKNPGSDEPCEAKWRNPRDLVVYHTGLMAFKIQGVDQSTVRAFWWHDSFGWQQFSSLRPPIPLGSYPGVAVKVESPGFLPLTRVIKPPSVSQVERTADQLQTEVPMSFQFDAGVQRRLVVRAKGRPLQGATVDLEWIENLDKDSRRQLATYKTPANGEISVTGGADQHIEAFVYAAGYEPRRAIWNTGALLTLDLRPRDAILSFAAQPSVALARVRPAGSAGAVRTLRLDGGNSQLNVAAGEYDITTYTGQGKVFAYQRAAVAARHVVVIDGKVDQRPRLTVRYPNVGWRSSISDSSPPGGAIGWAAMLVVSGTQTIRDVPATLVRETSEEAVYLLSRAGRMHLEVRGSDRGPSLWRDIDVRPSEAIVIDVPGESGLMKGTMSTYVTGRGHEHGIAGPRMQLIADDPFAWSVTEYLPKRESNRGQFTIRGIPTGDYHVFHHLIGKLQTYNYGSKPDTDTIPTAAWGGVPVKISAGVTAQLRDFAEDRLGDLAVRVSDQAGRPLDRATIRIRDRMSDSWRQVEENPAQLEQAGHPIPYPTSVRVAGGRAVLPNIRSGRLEFAVETDAGPSYLFAMPVTLGQELRVALPAGAGQ